jgi:hypothetical protein
MLAQSEIEYLGTRGWDIIWDIDWQSRHEALMAAKEA